MEFRRNSLLAFFRSFMGVGYRVARLLQKIRDYIIGKFANR
jgi:hypothetical protein